MRIKLRRAYDPPEPGEQLRVLVDRLWPRGVGKDTVDLWMNDIAPSTELRKWYGHAPERWGAFRAKYLKELERNREAVAELRKAGRGKSVTLLYGARDRERNQAVVLEEFLRSK